MVPLSRLTTIAMPHRNQKAVLRPPKKKGNQSKVIVQESKFKSMTTMELLGHGLATTLHRRQGWLKNLLLAEGKRH
jgi:hypothetical protein